jgi:hypothetical protein
MPAACAVPAGYFEQLLIHVGLDPRTARPESWLFARVSDYFQAIKYTDDGFSLGVLDDELFEWSLFLKAKVETDRERTIRGMFNELGAVPRQDYLADYGRTRIVTYSFPRDLSMATSLCERLLRDVYEMHANDELFLDFHPKRMDDRTR